MKEKLTHTLKVPMNIAGASIGLGIIGSGFNSPSLISAGNAAAGFVGSAVNITAGGYVIKQLRGLSKIKK